MAQQQIIYIEAGGSRDDATMTADEARAEYDEKFPEPDEKLVARDRVVDPETESEGTLQEFAEGLWLPVSPRRCKASPNSVVSPLTPCSIPTQPVLSVRLETMSAKLSALILLVSRVLSVM